MRVGGRGGPNIYLHLDALRVVSWPSCNLYCWGGGGGGCSTLRITFSASCMAIPLWYSINLTACDLCEHLLLFQLHPSHIRVCRVRCVFYLTSQRSFPCQDAGTAATHYARGGSRHDEQQKLNLKNLQGLLLPLCQSGTCTLREAVIVSSIINRVSIPVVHSAAALLRLADMEYSGTTSFFIRVLLDKKYAMPYRVVSPFSLTPPPFLDAQQSSYNPPLS